MTNRSEFQVIYKDALDRGGFLCHDLQLLAYASVSQWHGTADPETFALGGGNLVANAFPDHLAFELSKREKDI